MSEVIERYKERLDNPLRDGIKSLSESAKQVGHIEVYRAVCALPNGAELLRQIQAKMQEQGTLKV